MFPDPSGVPAQHRYQVSLTVHYHHHEGERYPPTGPTARHLERDEVVACDAAGKDNGRSAVQDSRKSVGSFSPVHSAGEIAGDHRNLLSAIGTSCVTRPMAASGQRRRCCTCARASASSQQTDNPPAQFMVASPRSMVPLTDTPIGYCGLLEADRITLGFQEEHQ
jgi:hypothetical protein